MGSEPEQKRQIIGLTLQNLRIKNGKVLYGWVKPFDSIFKSAESLTWGRLYDVIMNLDSEQVILIDRVVSIFNLGFNIV